jgi:hypothetical protein
MDADMDNSGAIHSDTGKNHTIRDILASALNMEDEISSGVYQEYLKAENWPPGMNKDVFLQIRKRLTILIQGVEKHKKTLQALSKECGRDRQPT